MIRAPAAARCRKVRCRRLFKMTRKSGRQSDIKYPSASDSGLAPNVSYSLDRQSLLTDDNRVITPAGAAAAAHDPRLPRGIGHSSHLHLPLHLSASISHRASALSGKRFAQTWPACNGCCSPRAAFFQAAPSLAWVGNRCCRSPSRRRQLTTRCRRALYPYCTHATRARCTLPRSTCWRPSTRR